ncbi:MAG: metal-dependent hydrolase [Acidobacteriota bacterium]
MPSPVGHALAALTVGWAVAPPPATPRAVWTQAAIFAALGVAPDLDLLIGRHRAESHSIGAAMIVATAAVVMRWPVARTRARTWLAVCCAWFSHAVLDSLGTDRAAPLGILAWWPFSRDYFITAWDVFLPIPRRWTEHGFTLQVMRAATREFLILAPIAALMFWVRTRRWWRPRGG